MQLIRKAALTLIIIIVLPLVFLITPPSNHGDMIKKYANQHSKFLSTSSGLRIHYRDQGAQDGPPIVLLHGNSLSLHFYEPLIGQMENQFRLISYDLPGHGLTGPTLDQHYEYKIFADALDELTAALGLQKFVLVGHSMGGWISWRYASENPDKVAALVLLTASGNPPRKDIHHTENGLGFKLANTRVGQVLSRFITPRFLLEQSNTKAIYDDSLVSDELVTMTWELLRFPGNQTAFAKRAQMSRQPELFDMAKNIKAPTLLIWGAEDTFIPAQTAESFEKQIPNTETKILAEVGHLPMYEAPGHVAELISDFVRQHWRN